MISQFRAKLQGAQRRKDSTKHTWEHEMKISKRNEEKVKSSERKL